MRVFCSDSDDRINESVVRLIAFFVAIIALCCSFSGNFWAFSFLTLDFGLRAFSLGRFSLLKMFALKFTNELDLPVKWIDLVPKRFAALMGFVLCLLTMVSYLANLNQISLILAIVIFSFAILESAFSFCIGCYIYSLKRN